MSTPSKTPNQNIGTYLSVDEEYAPPSIVAEHAILKDWSAEYHRSVADPDYFWGEYAKKFSWSKPWKKVWDFDGIHHKWFLGAKTNITINALDRHAKSDRFNRVAYIWLGEDGTERVITY